MNRISMIAGLLAFGASAAADPLPDALQPPASAAMTATLHAEGVQIYLCNSASAWALEAPDAVLSDEAGAKRVHHYAGPTWEAADGSKVVGKLVAKSPAPQGGAIPWLLLSATPTGTGLLADVHWIRRIATEGGVAPTGACTSGAQQRVPYKATYVFYR